MKPAELVTYTLRWHGRAAADVPAVYGTGAAVVQVVPRGVRPAVVDALWNPGCGYEIVVTFPSGPAPRQLSDAAKQGIRRKSLQRRIDKAAPLFAAELYSDALATQTEYFGTQDTKGKK